MTTSEREFARPGPLAMTTSDTRQRQAQRAGDPVALYHALRRRGLVGVFVWDGNGIGDGNGSGCGYGDGDGCGYGYGNGSGCGYGYGNGSGYGSGNGSGNGYGSGNGSGNGSGSGNGYGSGKPTGGKMQTTDLIPVNTPVVLRSYVSGVIVGRIQAGAAGSVALADWRWIRRWEDVGNEGSVYDLVNSDKVPTGRGPFTETLGVFQQADAMVISEEAYQRLAHG